MQNNIHRILVLSIALVLSMPAIAQRENDRRTLTTEIADLLAEMPTNNSKQFTSAMNKIAAMGEEGLLKMSNMFVNQKPADNSKLEYALGGFSFYVTQTGKEDLRKLSVRAYCSALKETENIEHKAFLIRQLEMVGKADAVSCLSEYLNNEQLCAPAAKALVNINSERGNEALLEALKNSGGSRQISLIHALGDTKYKEAVTTIIPLAGSEDPQLRKVALYALANIADPDSKKVLKKAAEEDDFTYDVDNATSAYLLYGQRLLENGHKKQAKKVANSLLDLKKEDQLYVRTAGLELLTNIQGKESTKILVKATRDDNPEYRAAALKFASPFINPETTAVWVKRLKKANPTVAAEIISMLGINDAREAVPAIVNALDSRHEQVKLAAIGALGRIGDAEVVPELLKALKKGETEEIAAIKQALLIIDANGLENLIADAIPNMPAPGQEVLLYVLGHRAASNRLDDVFSYVKDENDAVRKAALTALKQMVTKEDLPRLFLLLNGTAPKEVALVQQAIVAAIDNYQNQDQKTTLVLEQLKKTPDAKKPRYFALLANIGGDKALKAVSSAFEVGAQNTKKAALKALSSWSDASATKILFQIAEAGNGDFKIQALEGYIRAVSESNYPDAQKLLLFQKAMDIAEIQQIAPILKEIRGFRTFPTLVFAGKFLDRPQLQQEAALTVMNIALNNNFNGKVVRGLLEKAMPALEGRDAEYQRKAILKYLKEMPKGKGFVALFNGKDLTGWKGLVANPIARAKMNKTTLAKKQKKANTEMRSGWEVRDGELIFTGKGNNIATQKDYADFEMFVDWKIYDDGKQNGDAGIYLRGTPQVQIWDTSRVNVGAQVGSGGLYNNQKYPSDPLVVADNPLGEWNNFHIIMKGNRVTVYLNGVLVTDNVILENYWNREIPIFPKGQIELQAHGSRIGYRNIYIREIPVTEPFQLSEAEKEAGFEVLFDGTNMQHWIGNKTDYVVEDGKMVVREPKFGNGGNLYTKKEYEDFIFRFEFKLTPGANNGLGIRAPMEGDAAYAGMELQILDNTAAIYENLEDYQYHGSLYGVAKAKRGFLKPVGEWNYQEVMVNGPEIKVILNGTTILETNISDAIENGSLDGKEHPGLKREKGHIGFLGHGSEVWFRNIRIKELN